MIDELRKVREEIEALRKQPDKTDTTLGFNFALRPVLEIIDRHIEQASRKPRGEWVLEENRVWVLKNHRNSVRVYGDINGEGKPLFFVFSYLYRHDGGKNEGTFPTLPAAQLAAEEALEKMEGKQ